MSHREALLVVGHGTRTAAGVAQFHALLDRVRACSPHLDVAGGFLELAPPPLATAVRELVDRGHRDIAVVPLVLVAAGHAKGDVPAALAREQRRHPGVSFRYGRPLGPHPYLLDAMEQRIDAVLERRQRAETAVVLVGRGSTDPDANAETVKVARLLWEGRQFGTVETSFVSLALPDVPATLEKCRRLGYRCLVVAPYFLFAGVLPERIVGQARAYAGGQPELDVRCADVIGPDDRLAELVLERYVEARHGDLRMNCDTCLYRVALPGFESRVGAPQHPHDHPEDHAHPADHSHPADHAHPADRAATRRATVPE